MKTEHTPGPWEVLSGHKKPWSVWGAGSDKNLIVARVHGNDYSQSLRNANLIAAAPDLLEALELTTQRLEILNASLAKDPRFGDSEYVNDKIIDQAKAAINKAKIQ